MNTFAKREIVVKGVKWIPEKKTELMFITLNKRKEDYSPDTRYEDYPKSHTLFHWQSQNDTSEDSEVGIRYRQSKEKNYKMLLFVRESKKLENGVTSPYYFLGDATYMEHLGEKPMDIIWQLTHPIPEFLFAKWEKYGKRRNSSSPDDDD